MFIFYFLEVTYGIAFLQISICFRKRDDNSDFIPKII